MKKRTFILFILTIFIINFISAGPINDTLHLNIQTVNSSDDIVTGTFHFEFNISTTEDCANVVYNNFTNLTTDSRGIISYYLENTNLNYSDQYWLCYYRDGTLINASKIARNPYSFTARNVTLSGVEVDSNLDTGIFNITASWFKGLFNWTTLNNWLNFDGATLSFNETRLNDTILQEGLRIGFNSTYNATYHNYWAANYTNNSNLLDGYDSSYFMPLNTSVSGDFAITGSLDIDGDWASGGVSIDGGDIWAQTIYVYNLSSLNINTLSVNGSILPPVGFDNTFDIGSSSLRWKDLYLSGQLYSNGTGDNYFLGKVGIGTDSLSAKLDINGDSAAYESATKALYVNGTVEHYREETTSSTARPVAFDIETRANPGSSLASYQDFHGLDISTWTSSSNMNNRGRLYPFESTAVSYLQSGQENLSAAVGGFLQVIQDGTGAIDIAYDLLLWTQSKGNGTVIDNYGIYLRTPDIEDSSTITNNYGLYIEDQGIGETKSYSLYVNGTAPSYINGKIGFGVESPLAQFELKSSALNNLGGFLLRSKDSTTGFPVLIYEGSSNEGNIDLSNGSNALKVHLDAVGNSYFNGGNVGIGTTTPNALLEIMKRGGAGYNLNVSGLLYVNDTNVGIGTSSPAYLLEIANSATALNVSGLMYVNSSNVGIGTVSPTRTFDVESNDAVVMDITGNSGVSNQTFLDIENTVSSVNMRIGVFDTVGGISYGGAITPNLAVDSSGNIGIGTSSPRAKFAVASAGGTDQISIRHDNADTWFESTDGTFVFKSVEAADANTGLYLHPNGAGYSILRLYDQNVQNYLSIAMNNGYGSISTASAGGTPQDLRLQYSATGNVDLFTTAAEGTTKELKISGYRTGDALRTLQIGVGTDADDTASFDGVSNYLFDGKLKAQVTGGLAVVAQFTSDQSANNYSMVDIYNSNSGKTFRMGYFDGGIAGIADTSTTVPDLSIVGANIGIGTTAPSTNLEIYGSTGLSLNYTSGSQTQIYFKEADTTRSQFTSNFADDKFYFYHNGANRMVIDDTGQVGIGTVSPEANLDVRGSVADPSLSAENGIFTFGDSSGIFLEAGRQSSSPYAMWLQAKKPSTDESFPLILNPLGGNVGIGTSSPTKKLHVAGDVIIADSGDTDLILQNAGGANNSIIWWYNSTGSPEYYIGQTSEEAKWGLYNYHAGEYSLVVGTDGKVGIGTTTPTHTLNVVGDLNVTGTSYLGDLIINADNITVNNIISKDGNISFWNSTNDEIVRFVDDGNVGIGTSSPSAKLDVEVSSGGIVRMGSSGSIATGNHSIAIGRDAIAFGNYSTAIGYDTNASGHGSTAIGYTTTASGIYSTAMGYGTTASGTVSTAMGRWTTASGAYSTTMGDGIEAGSNYVVAIALDDESGVNCNQANSMCIIGGNVGIGTTAPTHELNVVGDVNVTENITITGCIIFSTGGQICGT